ncbi:GTPase HflX [Elusimicrobiota bacterium]
MEKSIIVGFYLSKTKKIDVERSLDELSRLAETAGAKAEIKIVQKRSCVDPAYLIGFGKACEIRDIVHEQNIKTVIFDDELKPSQQRNLEELIEAKIVDRTRLILDIFAKRARSREGILQVERAQLEYYLTRLSKKGTMLDSQTGGIGTRGPGERKLETDQRRIRDRISYLEKQLNKIKSHHNLLRRQRLDSESALIAIVGYTNVGKSSILNTLTKTNRIYADDKLFATLDPTTRKIKLAGGRTVLFTDTVGFIDKLPHALVSAFSSTLEETRQATCLLHVIDASHPEHKKQIKNVVTVLKSLGADKIPIIYVYNKCDLLSEREKDKLLKHGHLLISAKTTEGIDILLDRIEKIVNPELYSHKLILSYKNSKYVQQIFKMAVIKNQKYTARGISIRLESTDKHWKQIQKLLEAKA